VACAPNGRDLATEEAFGLDENGWEVVDLDAEHVPFKGPGRLSAPP
jgi:hypothetical protein